MAQEEAQYVGAQFQPNVLHWGMEQEDKMYDDWERWARQQILEKAQKRAAFSGEGTPVGMEDVDEDILEDPKPPEPAQLERATAEAPPGT